MSGNGHTGEFQRSKRRRRCRADAKGLQGRAAFRQPRLGNEIAKNAYLKQGLSAYQLDPEFGNAIFWTKALTN